MRQAFFKPEESGVRLSLTMKLTVAILVLTFALLIWGAYLLATQGRQLEQLRAELVGAREASAQRRAQLLVLEDALVANNDLLAGFGSVSELIDSLCGTGRTGAPRVRIADLPGATDLLNRCSRARSSMSGSMEFVRNYSTVAARRATADSDAEFRSLARAYRELHQQYGASESAGWQSRLVEGLAYAQYRLGNLPPAEQTARQAMSLDPNSAFAALTALKISCNRDAPAVQIRNRYTEHLGRLRTVAANSPPGIVRRYADLEVHYFQSDPELAVVCDYARLPVSDEGSQPNQSN